MPDNTPIASLKHTMYATMQKVADDIAAQDAQMGFYARRKVAHVTPASTMGLLMQTADDIVRIAAGLK